MNTVSESTRMAVDTVSESTVGMARIGRSGRGKPSVNRPLQWRELVREKKGNGSRERGTRGK